MVWCVEGGWDVGLGWIGLCVKKGRICTAGGGSVRVCVSAGASVKWEDIGRDGLEREGGRNQGSGARTVARNKPTYIFMIYPHPSSPSSP